MAPSHGVISPIVGRSRVEGVMRSGKGKITPAPPNVSGRAPRSEATTGIPLAIASKATKPWLSHHNEGIRQTPS